MVAKAAGGSSCWTSGVPVVILVVCFMVTAVVGEYSVNASYNRTRNTGHEVVCVLFTIFSSLSSFLSPLVLPVLQMSTISIDYLWRHSLEFCLFFLSDSNKKHVKLDSDGSFDSSVFFELDFCVCGTPPVITSYR